ncbi:MAG: hypothetical protein HY700_16915 [Gemmatimonadetes bacterium]|nr:hypothetical protein [Gemmatimonadota bacterium]
MYRRAVQDLRRARHQNALEIVRGVAQAAGAGESAPHSYPFYLLVTAYIIWEAAQLGIPLQE